MSVHILEDSSHSMEAPAFVRHRRRPSWGTDMLVGEDGRRRRYQFEDGKLRAFKEGFFHLLEAMDDDEEDTSSLQSTLHKKHDAALARREISARRRSGDHTAIRLVDQFLVFRDIYPEGFEDPLFIERSRMPDPGKNTCKRHVDAAIELGAVHLDPAQLHATLQEGRHDAVLQHFLRVAMRTDLLAVGRDIKPLQGLDPAWHPELAVCLFNLVLAASKRAEPEDPTNKLEDALDAWVGTLEAALEEAPSWQLATAPAAFVAPDYHLVVQPTVFRLQARWSAPTLRWTDSPVGQTYVRLRDMADVVRDKLVEEGLQPRDHFDTARFMWETLRQRGRQRLKEIVLR